MTMVTAQKSHRTIAGRLIDELTTAIVGGDMGPGMKISEPELAKRYQVSRGPLREAIRRLEGRGLIRYIPHSGARVVSLELIEIMDLYVTREALEGMAARLAARNMRSKEIDTVKFLLDEHEKDIGLKKGREYFQEQGDLDFHFRIVQGSDNKKLLSLLCGELYYLVRMYRYRSSQTQSRPQKALSEHRQIMDAIALRDEELAEILMRRHIDRARQNLAEQIETSVTSR